MGTLYTDFELSKTNKLIPLCNNVALCSRYDPEKEGLNFARQFSISDNFFIIGGLCGGYHISALLQQNPHCKIIVVEDSHEDFKALMQIDNCKELSENKNVIFCTLKELYKTIIENYLPAKYGNLKAACFRSWLNINQTAAEQIFQIITLAQKSISADFSVQSNFGKIWQKNIFLNLKIAAKTQNQNDSLNILKKAASQNKTACIIAAGPSLDQSINQLKTRNDIFIIATDTALRKLNRLKIKCDAVISIDGQFISKSHFMPSAYNSHPVYFFDLCACHNAVKKASANNERICFFESGHPLSVTASAYSGHISFLHLTSGSGTVTITAADLAYKTGFQNIEFYGADFAYSLGKAYTSGTYLDDNYSLTQIKTDNAETRFDRLMYRTPLFVKSTGVYSNEILKSYEDSLNLYLSSPSVISSDILTDFNSKNFSEYYFKQISDLPSEYSTDLNSPAFFTLLPLMAYFQKQYNIEQSYVLARSNSLRYNELL